MVFNYFVEAAAAWKRGCPRLSLHSGSFPTVAWSMVHRGNVSTNGVPRNINFMFGFDGTRSVKHDEMLGKLRFLRALPSVEPMASPWGWNGTMTNGGVNISSNGLLQPHLGTTNNSTCWVVFSGVIMDDDQNKTILCFNDFCSWVIPDTY